MSKPWDKSDFYTQWPVPIINLFALGMCRALKERVHNPEHDNVQMYNAALLWPTCVRRQINEVRIFWRGE